MRPSSLYSVKCWIYTSGGYITLREPYPVQQQNICIWYVYIASDIVIPHYMYKVILFSPSLFSPLSVKVELKKKILINELVGSGLVFLPTKKVSKKRVKHIFRGASNIKESGKFVIHSHHWLMKDFSKSIRLVIILEEKIDLIDIMSVF